MTDESEVVIGLIFPRNCFSHFRQKKINKNKILRIIFRLFAKKKSHRLSSLHVPLSLNDKFLINKLISKMVFI